MIINVVQTPRLPTGVEALSVLNDDDSLTILVSERLSPQKCMLPSCMRSPTSSGPTSAAIQQMLHI
ncbi:MAG: hypothetical protein ACLVLA_05480 [Acidaminococcus intestini]